MQESMKFKIFHFLQSSSNAISPNCFYKTLLIKRPVKLERDNNEESSE